MKMNRRHFIKHAGITTASATQLSLLGSAANAAAGSDYCAMVCVLLAGGADSFNMLVPYDSSRYADYATTRSDLALPRETLLPLNVNEANGNQYAVHPGMAEIQSLFNQGDLSFIANVGPLAEPTSRAQYDAGTNDLPLGLFSHSDQIAVWQTSLSGERARTGVAGRMADLLSTRIDNGPISMNVSMSGTNLLQTGTSVSGYSVDPRDGVREIGGLGDPDNDVFTNAFNRLLSINFEDPFRRAYAQKISTTIESGNLMSEALAIAPVLNTEFSDAPFSVALAQIAKVISARASLGARRQTFFITVGGWDHHDEVINNQARMLPEICRGLSEFHAALTEMELLNAVTTFTISDFGRTLTSNGKGSDHGWGGNTMVMGGGINGGQILGDFPDLSLGNELDLGRGRFLPTTSTDELYAELALWFGVQESELDLVLPNIRRFYSAGQSLPLGLFV
jgi:uncharacterized protein (DUF1501 family)